ncbi:ABC transporter ATP-binding protein [Actinokineospora xionganensis]|uniref:ABC transporter ATP-binding protein n=1 Tax=Actinokineospora xionganensis TaxID=2684470 RepID=A0ABR7L4N8_9PSEU|nr:ABC transporter ATP-binding protein [Actinokineospora xionganensis]MBC6447537.1 ABC transporter ATP-binding protein [Actinokineospora xionganensis]
MSGRPSVVTGILRIAYAADPRATSAVLVLACVNALSVAASGLSVRQLANSSSTAALWLAVVVGAVAYAMIAAVLRVQHNLQVDLTERVDLVLSQRLFGLASRTPTLEHLERPEFLDRLSSIRSGTETLAGACWGAVGAGSSMLSLGLSVWLLTDVHPALALLVLLAVPPLVFSRRASRLLGQARDRMADAERREEHLHRLGTEAEAAKELRISQSHRVIGARADAYWESATAVLVRAQGRAALWQAAGWGCFAVGYVGALAFVAHLVARGSGTVGDLLMVASLSGYLRMQLQATVTGASQLAEGRHTMRRLWWLEDHAERQSHTGTEPAPRGLTRGISLRGVSFTYPGTDNTILREIDLELRAGSTVAIVGVNGAGKTTLVKLLTGMYEPTAGEIAVDGVALKRLDLDAWRARHAIGIGDLPRADDPDAVARAVESAHAQAVVDRLPAGLDSQLGRIFDGAELSRGQWQKVALARAMMRGESLLWILDEPTAALDPQTEHDLYERFVGADSAGRGAEGAITLLVSHRFSTVRMADHIVVLSDGEVAEEGTHAQLMERAGPYAELYGTQSRAYTAAQDS